MNDKGPTHVLLGYSSFDHVKYMRDLGTTASNTGALLRQNKEELSLSKKQHKEMVYLHNTALQQNKRLYQMTEKGFTSVVENLNLLGTTIGAELHEVRWVLAHIEGSLNEFVELFRNKRETEAHELVRDASKALKAARFEDAEDCLLKAIDLKRTDFKAHLTLGFVYREIQNKEGAIDELNKSYDYADDDNEKVFVLANLAITCSMFEEYEQAIVALNKVIEYKQANGYVTTADKYQLAINQNMAGNTDEAIDLLLTLFRMDPAYCQPALLEPRLQSLQNDLVKRVNDHAQELEKGISEKLELLKKNVEAVDSGRYRYALDDPQLGKRLMVWVDLAEQALASKSYSSLLFASEMMFYSAGGVAMLSDIIRLNEIVGEKAEEAEKQSKIVDQWKSPWYRFPQLRFLPPIAIVVFSLVVLIKGFKKIPAHWDATSHKFLSVLFYYPVVIFITIILSALLLWAAYRLFRYMNQRWMEKINEVPSLSESTSKLEQAEKDLAAEQEQLNYVRQQARDCFETSLKEAENLKQDLGLEQPKIEAKRPEGSYTLRDLMPNTMIDDPAPDDPWPLTKPKVQEFLQNFLDMPFFCDNPVQSVVFRTGKMNLPSHSLLNGLLYSQSLEQIKKNGEWPEPAGAIELQFGGKMKPAIKVHSVDRS